MSIRKVNTEQATACLIDSIKVKVMPILVGSPGIGKSAVVKAVAEEYNLELIDIRLSQCDPVDLLGFPDIDREAGKSRYVPMEIFPLENDPLPAGKNGWLLFFDEANSADRAVQKAWYKTVLDRQVGNHNIHPHAAMISAGNLSTDGAIVEDMSTALESRMSHFELDLDHKCWLDWAMKNGIDYRITSFIQFKPEMLYTFKPDHTDKTYASPRTWEFANRYLGLRDNKDPILRINLSGTISEGVAREFLMYCDIFESLASIQDIIRNPNDVELPVDTSVLFAMTGSIAQHMNDQNIDPLMQYVGRLPMEFQVVCLREAIRRNPTIGSTTAVGNWIAKNQAELWD